MARGQHDRPARLVHFLRHAKALFHRMAEQLLEHPHDIVVGVVVVVEQDDVVRRLPADFFRLASARPSVPATSAVSLMTLRFLVHFTNRPAAAIAVTRPAGARVEPAEADDGDVVVLRPAGRMPADRLQ